MKRVIGIFIGIFYTSLAGLAWRHSMGGWSAGQSDIGFWWAVIGGLLGIAALGALIGSWIHTRSSSRAA